MYVCSHSIRCVRHCQLSGRLVLSIMIAVNHPSIKYGVGTDVASCSSVHHCQFSWKPQSSPSQYPLLRRPDEPQHQEPGAGSHLYRSKHLTSLRVHHSRCQHHLSQQPSSILQLTVRQWRIAALFYQEHAIPPSKQALHHPLHSPPLSRDLHHRSRHSPLTHRHSQQCLAPSASTLTRTA